MAILRRFLIVIKSYLNYLIGKAEDPEKMLNQMMIEMQEQLFEAKKRVAISIADEKRLAKQCNIENNLAKEWQKKAILAVRAGADLLANKALERKAEHAKHAYEFNKQWQTQKNSVEELKKALLNLNNKISNAKRKKNLLIARAKRAEAQKTISETISGLSTTNATETILRMEQKIDKMEAEAQATSELANEISTDSLSNKFEKLEIINTNDALAELKANIIIENNSKQKKDNQTTLKQIEEDIKTEISLKN